MSGSLLKDHARWVLLWGGLVGTALYTRPLLPVDETRYLSVAWEMWQSKQFLVPHINGLAYSHKPPLLFWLIQLGWCLFGVNDWSARLTAPLFGLGSILLTMRVRGILWPENREIARTLPYILLGMFVWSAYATLTLFDMPLVFFCLFAWLGLLRARQGQDIGSWLQVGLAVGLGLLAKGPVILLYIVPPAIFAPWWRTDQHASGFRWYGGFLLALAVGFLLALAWALPASRTGGPEYARAILLGQTAGRMVASFAHARPFFWYVLWLPPLFFPWIFWEPVWRGGLRQLDWGTRFCLSALVPPFFLLSCVSGKQLHYLLPLLPAATLLMARAVATSPGATSSRLRSVAAVYVVSGVALLIIPYLPLHGGDMEMLAFLPPWLGLFPLLPGLIFLFLKSDGFQQGITRVATGNILLLLVLHLALARPLHQLYDQTEVGTALHAAEAGGHLVATFPARLTAQFQFAGRLTRPLLAKNTLEEVVLWSGRNPGQYCFFMTTEEGSVQLRGNGTAARFKDGWLVVRPAAGLDADYLRWKGLRSEGPPTSPPG